MINFFFNFSQLSVLNAMRVSLASQTFMEEASVKVTKLIKLPVSHYFTIDA